MYDLPANFDYVEFVTGKTDLYYIGHSMGTTMFFVCMATRPEYNSRIRLMSALAPVSYTEHMSSAIALIAPFSGSIEWILATLGVREFLPNNAFMEFLGQTLCHQNSPVQAICSNVLFIVMGYDFAQLNSVRPDLNHGDIC